MSTNNNNVENVVVNVDFQRRDLSSIFANEVQVVPGDIAWEDLELMLKIYSNHEHIKVSYADNDNDLVVIESEEELKEAFKVARKCNNTLKLTVICENQLGPHDLFDLEREPALGSLDDSQLLDMSPGRVLYRCGVKGDEPLLTPRGGKIGAVDKVGCVGVDDQKAMTEEPNLSSAAENKSFFIVNKRCGGMVLDVEGCGVHPGARVIVWYRKRAIEGIKNQLWYQDNRTMTIRTCLNDFCLDVVDGRLVVNPCDLNSISQKWTICGNRIQNVFNHKWVIGLKKDEVSACDEVHGLAEEELSNTEWTMDDPDRERCENVICGNPFLPNLSCSLFLYENGGYCGPTISAFCDICDQIITGVRYKCGFCPDFDLCATCESKDGVHDPTHLLLKMRVPQEQTQMKLSTLEPVLRRNATECMAGVSGQLAAMCRVAEKQTQNEDKPMQQKIDVEENFAWSEMCSREFDEPVDQTKSDSKSAEAVILLSKTSLGKSDISSEYLTIKQWKIQNTGTSAWTSDAKVGPIETDLIDEVRYMVTTEPEAVGGLLPDGVVSVTITAATRMQDEDTRACHSVWSLHDGKEYFGPLLDFDFTIYREQDLFLKSPADFVEDGKTGGSRDVEKAADGVTFSLSRNGELAMMEDLLDAKLSELKLTSSALTVPSNTPLADTPPRTPMILELGEDRSVPQTRGMQTVPSSCEENFDHVNMAIMADLVHRKMSDIATDGDYEYVDVERVSNSSSSTDDFYVVPIPDCFNPNLPARKEASTTVIVKKSDVRGSYSVDDMLSTSSYLLTEALLSPRSCFSVSSINDELRNDYPEPPLLQEAEALSEPGEIERPRDLQDVNDNVETTDIKISEANNTELEIWQTDEIDCAEADAAADSDENTELNAIVNGNEVSQDRLLNQVREALESSQQEEQQQNEEQQRVASNEGQVVTEHTTYEEATYSASGVEASTLRLVSTVFSFVTKTAKDVFSTFQDKSSYTPPRSNWTPPQSHWTPTVSTWTPQEQPTWSPTSTPQWNPPSANEDAPSLPAADLRSPMDQLIEMGFADRQLNQQLLQSCGNNMEVVIQKLVEMNGSIR